MSLKTELLIYACAACVLMHRPATHGDKPIKPHPVFMCDEKEMNCLPAINKP